MNGVNIHMERSQVVNPTRAVVAGGRARNGCDICNICSRGRPSPSLPLVLGVLGVLVVLAVLVRANVKQDRHIVSNAPLDKCGSALHYRLPGPPYRLLAAAINIKHQSGRSMLSPAWPAARFIPTQGRPRPQAPGRLDVPWAIGHGPWARPTLHHLVGHHCVFQCHHTLPPDSHGYSAPWRSIHPWSQTRPRGLEAGAAAKQMPSLLIIYYVPSRTQQCLQESSATSSPGVSSVPLLLLVAGQSQVPWSPDTAEGRVSKNRNCPLQRQPGRTRRPLSRCGMRPT